MSIEHANGLFRRLMAGGMTLEMGHREDKQGVVADKGRII